MSTTIFFPSKFVKKISPLPEWSPIKQNCDSTTCGHLQEAPNTHSALSKRFAILLVCPPPLTVVTGENMASHTSKAFLSLGRINVAGFGLQTPVSRATYATGLSVNSSKGNIGEFHCRCRFVHADSEPLATC